MALTLGERWRIDGDQEQERSLGRRLGAAFAGALNAEARVRGQDPAAFPCGGPGPWLCAELLPAYEAVLAGSGSPGTPLQDRGPALPALVSPAAFALGDRFDFPLLISRVEEQTGLRKGEAALGAILYTEILFRLIHNDGFEEALDNTARLCGLYLEGTAYKADLGHYETLLKGGLKNGPPETSGAKAKTESGAARVIKAAAWSCLKSGNLDEAIENARGFADDQTEIALAAGIMAGLYYR